MDTFATKFIVGVLAAMTVGSAVAAQNVWDLRAAEYDLPRHEWLRVCDNDASYASFVLKEKRAGNVSHAAARAAVAGDKVGVYIVNLVYAMPEPEPGVSWNRAINLLETRIFKECEKAALKK